MWGKGLGLRAAALGLAGLVLVGVPAHGLAVSDIAALAKIERGRWEVVRSGADKTPRSLCLGDPMLLTQLEHGPGACTRELVESADGGGTVQYRCAGRGFGHTRIRIETPRWVRVDTQGIVDGRPFAWRGEARRVGRC